MSILDGRNRRKNQTPLAPKEKEGRVKKDLPQVF
jgi:hypothetical protein